MDAENRVCPRHTRLAHEIKKLSRPLLCVLLLASPVAAAGGDRRLVEAVERQDRKAVRTLLDQHANVNVPQADGATPLHWAVHWNDLQTAELLIRAGAHVNAANDYGITPISLACTNGNAAIVDALLKAGATAGVARRTGETALMTCARTGNVDAVNALLAHGADVNARESSQGQTALMWAAAQNHAEVARVLIEHGADVHTRTNTKTGFTPLLFAAREGALDAVRALLAKGADVNEASLDGSSVLLTATDTGHWELAKFLLDHGADPNADNGAGYTALHWATGSWDTFLSKSADSYQWLAARGPGKLELVNALLAHGSDPNARLKKSPSRGTGINDSQFKFPGATPMVLAGKAADVSVMHALLAAGANPRLTADDKTTVLMTAAGLGQSLAVTSVTHEDALAAVKLALDLMGADSINAVNDEGETALHAAAYFGVENVVQFLADHGANLNARNKLGMAPLTIAEGYGGSAGVVVHEGTAALIRKLGGIGGVDMPPMPITLFKTDCPLPTIYFPIRNPGNYGNLFVTTSAATQYTNGGCTDLKVGSNVRVKGVREMGQGKAWDGSVLATEIEIVK